MVQTTIGEQTEETILERLGVAAPALTDALYAEMPELRERGGPTTARPRCLELMDEHLRGTLPAEEAEAAKRCIRAGLGTREGV